MAISGLARNTKLVPRFYGLFQVVEKIGEVSYKLKLREGSLIYLVFHVSQLNKQLNYEVVSLSQLLPVDDAQGC